MSRSWLNQLTDCLSDGLAQRVGVWLGLAFVTLYLYSVGNLVIAPGTDLAFGRPIPAASVVSDWATKMWKPIAPFVWEPIVALFPIRPIALFISIPNLLLALLLGSLVALNIVVAVARARLVLTAKKSGFLSGFLASFPALLTGFACCVPTVILALGSLAAAFTVAAIAIAPYFLPLAALALVGNLVWGLRQYPCALRPASSKVAVKQNRSKHIGDVKLKTQEKEG
ncbi:MAG TPA: hypothetical protein VGW77_04615 [Candidatus Binatia bacterium]|jgi:hypothetical protein|nr:hypothetical protein [Candidatus Binatia bacterium]